MNENCCNNEVNAVEKSASTQVEAAERTRQRRVFTPRTDIFETNNDIVVLSDMPGVQQSNLDITLEQNTLTLNGFVEATSPDGHSLTYGEYGIGDYYRQFTLPNAVDREAISATIKDGVLKLVLPKSNGSKVRKIEVRNEN